MSLLVPLELLLMVLTIAHCPPPPCGEISEQKTVLATTHRQDLQLAEQLGSGVRVLAGTRAVMPFDRPKAGNSLRIPSALLMSRKLRCNK